MAGTATALPVTYTVDLSATAPCDALMPTAAHNFFSFLEKIGPYVVPLIAVALAWVLSRKSYVKEISLDNLRRKFDALREIKAVLDNISPNLSKEDLFDKLTRDAEFRKGSSERIQQLFGLRNELMPYIDPEFVEFIDEKLKPLFNVATGVYTYKEEKNDEFATFLVEAITMADSIEKKLTKEYKRHFKSFLREFVGKGRGKTV